MTDNGLAALAAALGDLFPHYQREKWPFTAEQAAAAILGERGVFLPDGLQDDEMDIALTAAVIANGKAATLIAEQAATIATLREQAGALAVEVTERGREIATLRAENERLADELSGCNSGAFDLIATIATLRAALDGLEEAAREMAAAYTDIEGDLINDRTDLAYTALRAALATAKEKKP